MKEQPEWFKGTIEGGKHDSEMSEAMFEQLSAALTVLEDEAPDGWESELGDAEEQNERRNEVIKLSNDEILKILKRDYVWSEPSYAKAIIDVIKSKIVPPRASSSEEAS